MKNAPIANSNESALDKRDYNIGNDSLPHGTSIAGVMMSSTKADVIFCSSLQEAFASAGMSYPDVSFIPGSVVRFPTNASPVKKAGWCLLFSDGIGAKFGCYKEGTTFVWQQRDVGAPPPSKQERRAARAKAEQEKRANEAKLKASHAAGAEIAAQTLSQSTDLNPAHRYVVSKGITPYGGRQTLDGSIVVPMYGPDGSLQSVQFIYPNGSKRFLAGARMKDGRLTLGDPTSDKPIILCEGWATGCSLYQATGYTVVVCFAGANLAKVADDLRNQFPDAVVQIAADRDAHGKGMEYAAAAAAAAAPASALLPVFTDGRDHGDFNDLHQAEGLDAVRKQFTSDISMTTKVVVPFRAPALPTSDARDGTGDTRPLTEYGNAQRLHDLHGPYLRYVYDSKSWLIWSADAWSWDRDGATVRSYAVALHQVIYKEGERYIVDAEHFGKWARKSQEERVVKAAVHLLSDFAPLRLPLAYVDADPFLIGFDQARQVIDLGSGTTRAAVPDDYVTKSLNVNTVGDAAKAERWIQFLDQIFGGDHELIDWLHRFCGYLLTGSTREQIFLFCHGLGANGKSVFIEVLKYILGDYARAIAPETLADSKRQGGSATPDLAALIGARLVMCNETEDNTAMAESLVKSLVSGDSMAVRPLYAAPIQFTPVFKLVMAGNHKPIVRGNDNGIWRRIRLIPFNRTFAPDERDPNLLAKLKAEAPDILAWMIEGCIKWLQQGLGDTPTTIEGATSEYREDQDIVGRWLEECTKRDPHGEESTTDLYDSYESWCLRNGLRPSSTVVLGRRLSDRGFKPRKSNGKRWWGGLTLTDAQQVAANAESYRHATNGY
jgi:P4 family phage/plasmid primase-like protien